MKRITIPAVDWDEVEGTHAVVPVRVDWPELRLAEWQVLANAVAVAAGEERPFPDHSYIEVVVERPDEGRL